MKHAEKITDQKLELQKTIAYVEAQLHVGRIRDVPAWASDVANMIAWIEKDAAKLAAMLRREARERAGAALLSGVVE